MYLLTVVCIDLCEYPRRDKFSNTPITINWSVGLSEQGFQWPFKTRWIRLFNQEQQLPTRRLIIIERPVCFKPYHCSLDLLPGNWNRIDTIAANSGTIGPSRSSVEVKQGWGPESLRLSTNVLNLLHCDSQSLRRGDVSCHYKMVPLPAGSKGR